jgi:hypothetical protein
MESTDRSDPKISCRGIYFLLLIPVVYFIISLFVRPLMSYDSAEGFIALRSMFNGAPFNYIASPDPGNIANNVETFLAWWSPGQYLAPGAFIWFGADYGLAIALTTLISTVIGLVGWVRLARNFDVSCRVLFLFIAGLTTFSYVTHSFCSYNGGDVLLFAVLPWSLLGLQWAVKKGPALSLATSMLLAGLLFFAKLSALFVFAANLAAISLLDIVGRRRLTFSLIAMWAGAAVAALLILVFWLARGPTPVSGSGYALTWPGVLYPFAASAFSGFPIDSILNRVFLYPSAPILSNIGQTSYVLGPFGLMLMGWVWFRLRNTRYRPMAVCLLSVIAFYVAGYVAMYVRNGNVVPFTDRYFRYVGMLFFLLLLVAMDQWHWRLARGIPILIVGMFTVYGLTMYARDINFITRSPHYDPASGTAMEIVSPAVLEYLRSDMATHNWRDAIAVVPWPEAANGLPCYRIIFDFAFIDSASFDDIARQKWGGHVEKLFVIVDEKMRSDGKADAVLRSFVDYDPTKWSQIQMDGTIIYSQ